MECFCINLDSQPQRIDYLQRNFAAHKAPGWFLNRVPAIDKQYIAQHAVQGMIRAGEKGCFLSHRRAFQASLEAPGHAMILEDDAMFGPSSCASIQAALAKLPEDGWDLLFTDVSIYYGPLMVAIMQERRTYSRGGGPILMNMNEFPFCGSTAYVVNSRSKERMLALTDIASLDEPYDVFLRNLIRQEKIRSRLTFPFATSLSEFADSSGVQEGADAQITILNAFRRFVWLDRDVQAVSAGLDRLGDNYIDADAAVFARIIGALLTQEENSARAGATAPAADAPTC